MKEKCFFSLEVGVFQIIFIKIFLEVKKNSAPICQYVSGMIKNGPQMSLCGCNTVNFFVSFRIYVL
jgi:hypothetical protein